MGKGGVPDVGLLDSENYWEWSLRIEDLLVYKELADCVQRDGAELADATEKLRDRKALSLIRSHVSAALLPYLQSQANAKEAWDTLKALNATSLEARKSMLEEQLLQLVKQKSEDVAEYVARAQKIRLELAAAGESVNDDRVIRAILRGLPDEFTNVKEFLLYQTGLTIGKVMTHLKVAEERVGSNSREAIALKSVVTKGRPRNMSKIECFNCGEKGHMKRECPNKKKKWKKPADAVAMSAVGATATDSYSGRDKTPGDEVVVAAAKVAEGGEHSVRRKIDWVLDSGATHHVLADESAAEDIKP
jgi:hypothetical protein